MSSSFEKSVKGGTKIKLAAPKSKYVEHILIATHTGEAGIAEVFRAMQNRLRDSTWTIVFKGLIIVHLMIREGEKDVTLAYIAANPRKLAISNFSEDTKVDYVRSGEGRLKTLPVDKGLLRETEAVQRQIAELVKCDLFSDESENEITLTAFRLLVTDLYALFYVMNEGVINILERFFEMSKYDAERALSIYKTFVKQTNQVVEYLVLARQYEHATRLEVPKLKHAPTSLANALEEYVRDPDFELARREYLAQQEAKKNRGKGNNASSRATGADKSNPLQQRGTTKDIPAPSKATGAPSAAAPARKQVRGPDPDLIDFFESIEQNQQPMAQSLPSAPPQIPVSQMPQQGYAFQPQELSAQNTQQAFVPPQTLFGTTQAELANTQLNPIFNSPPIQLAGPSAISGTGFSGFSPAAPPQPGVPTFTPSVTGNQQDAAFAVQNTQFALSQQPSLLGNLQAQGQQSTNPFRQSMMPTGTSMSTAPSFGGGTSLISPVGPQQSSNPFARVPQQADPVSMPPPLPTGVASAAPSPFQAGSSSQLYELPQAAYRPVDSSGGAPRSTNPFAQMLSAASLADAQHQPAQQPQPPQPGGQPASLSAFGGGGGIGVQATGGDTNPFRKSMFQAMNTGGNGTGGNPSSAEGAWPPQGQQATMGGLEQLPTVSVFPRSG